MFINGLFYLQGAIKGAVKIEAKPKASKQDTKSGWLTYLGIGVAATALVGALTIR